MFLKKLRSPILQQIYRCEDVCVSDVLSPYKRNKNKTRNSLPLSPFLSPPLSLPLSLYLSDTHTHFSHIRRLTRVWCVCVNICVIVYDLASICVCLCMCEREILLERLCEIVCECLYFCLFESDIDKKCVVQLLLLEPHCSCQNKSFCLFHQQKRKVHYF